MRLVGLRTLSRHGLTLCAPGDRRRVRDVPTATRRHPHRYEGELT